MNIVLTGFMATGKTAVSEALARISDFELVDTDKVIVENAGMSISDIFAKFGEEEFRKMEHTVICDVSELDNTIISTGGGVPLNKDNMQVLRKNGIIVNLYADFQVIAERLGDARAGRPLLKDSGIEEIQQRFETRLPFYEDCDIKIEVSNEHSPEYFAREILKQLKLIQ